MPDEARLLAVLERTQAEGFLGAGPVAAHITHAEAFLAAVPPPRSLLDLGSGGGVPGLVLATRWTSTEAVLLDAQLRRVVSLRAAIDELGCADRVRAVHGRAEDLARDLAFRGQFEVVTARSFGPPALTAECAAGFLRSGGVLLVAEPPGLPDRWPADGLRSLGFIDDGAVSGGDSAVRRLRTAGPPLDRVPRRAAALRRHPAF